jgi:hypothetical protein
MSFKPTIFEKYIPAIANSGAVASYIKPNENHQAVKSHAIDAAILKEKEKAIDHKVKVTQAATHVQPIANSSVIEQGPLNKLDNAAPMMYSRAAKIQAANHKINLVTSINHYLAQHDWATAAVLLKQLGMELTEKIIRAEQITDSDIRLTPSEIRSAAIEKEKYETLGTKNAPQEKHISFIVDKESRTAEVEDLLNEADPLNESYNTFMDEISGEVPYMDDLKTLQEMESEITPGVALKLHQVRREALAAGYPKHRGFHTTQQYINFILNQPGISVPTRAVRVAETKQREAKAPELNEIILGNGLRSGRPNKMITAPVGNLCVDIKKLDRSNTLSISYKNKHKIAGMPNFKVSDKMKAAVLSLVNQKKPNVNGLTVNEKQYLQQLIDKSGIYLTLQHRTVGGGYSVGNGNIVRGAVDEIDMLQQRIQVLLGEIKSENKNPAIKNELSTLLGRALQLEILNPKQIANLTNKYLVR